MVVPRLLETFLNFCLSVMTYCWKHSRFILPLFMSHHVTSFGTGNAEEFSSVFTHRSVVGDESR